jgi:hypothetical protein
MADIPDDVRKRAWLDNVKDYVTRKAQEVAKDYSGFPGDVYGEAVNRVMAGGRSILPGGGSYDEELQRVKEAREEDYPGAYSVIPEVRKRGLAKAAEDSGVSAAIGVVGPIRFAGKPKGLGVRLPHPEEDAAWRGSHRPPGPDNGAPLSDLTGEGRIYPDDVYGPQGQRIYGTREPSDAETFRLARTVHGNPEAEVTAYRAVASPSRHR